MIARLSSWFRRLRRGFSRSEWAIRWFGLSRSQDTAIEPGLLLIQIDGLAYEQLLRAVEHGQMKFLRRLLRLQGYRLHKMFSGLPSATPGVQGELFYGQPRAVPAFGFRDHETGEPARMAFPGPASKVEARLAQQGEGLLAGGSCYVNVYTGGAAEPHFCAASSGLGGTWRVLNPLAWCGLILWHITSLLRIGVLATIEFGMAVVDCIRGMYERGELWKELQFVPARVAVSVVLRELATSGAVIDVTRGLPIVQVNFLGYDEQAHRRGPSSMFAHWTLRGIDAAIRRMTRAARRSACRDYDIWIYSDHGQEETRPYVDETGRTLDEAVAEVFSLPDSSPANRSAPIVETGDGGEQRTRASWLGGRIARRLFQEGYEADETEEVVEPAELTATVSAIGPLAHVYPSRDLTDDEKRALARRLVADAHVPIVFYSDGPDTARAFTPVGEFALPDQATEVLGAEHPFLRDVTREMVLLARHPDAGTFLLSGWRPHTMPLSFPIEHGAHGGPGAQETQAFALVPSDVFPPDIGYLRPRDLRQAARHLLGRDTVRIDLATNLPAEVPSSRTATLRVLTYNVHACRGLDGKVSPLRIARVLGQCEPDVAALQELDVFRPRSGQVDQAHMIASRLEMDHHFHAALCVEEEQYGDAVLSSIPLRLVRCGPLPNGGRRREPRGALWVELMIGSTKVQLINTHLGLSPQEQLAQIEALLGPDWLGHPDCRPPLILCGDFNFAPGSRPYARLRERLRDAQCELNRRPQPTWFSSRPIRRIDHVFVSADCTVRLAQVFGSDLCRVASDHLPLLVEIETRLPAESPP